MCVFGVAIWWQPLILVDSVGAWIRVLGGPCRLLFITKDQFGGLRSGWDEGAQDRAVQSFKCTPRLSLGVGRLTQIITPGELLFGRRQFFFFLGNVSCFDMCVFCCLCRAFNWRRQVQAAAALHDERHALMKKEITFMGGPALGRTKKTAGGTKITLYAEALAESRLFSTIEGYRCDVYTVPCSR